MKGRKALVLQSLWGPMTQCTLTPPSLEAENSLLLPSHPSPDSPQALGYYFHGSGSEDVWPWWFMVLFSMWHEKLLLVLTHGYRHPLPTEEKGKPSPMFDDNIAVWRREHKAYASMESHTCQKHRRLSECCFTFHGVRPILLNLRHKTCFLQ